MYPTKTNRPDITNSSNVVTVGRLQKHNGTNTNASDVTDIFQRAAAQTRCDDRSFLEVVRANRPHC